MATTQPVEVEKLRAELETLQRQLASEKAERHARARSVTSWVLVALAVIATTLSLLSVWTFRTLTNTELFVERVGSIIEQPEVAAAVGETAAAQLVQGIDLEGRLQSALPEELAVAAGPISTAAQDYLAKGVTSLVQTDQFQAAWDAALTAGHRLTVGVLSGKDTAVVENSDGVIVLNLTPVVNSLLAEGSDFLSDLLGRDINAPVVTDDTIDAAVAALEEQLGTDLPAEFGQVTVFASEDLATAQAWYQTIQTAVWLAPVAALVLIGLALALSSRRLRAAMVIVVGVAILMLLVGVALEPIEASVVGAVEQEALQGAVASAFSTVLSSLLTGIRVVVVLGILAALVLFLTGRSRAAVSTRDVLARAPRLAAQHRGWFLGGGAVVALLLMAVIPGRSWGQLGIVLLVYAGYALAVLLAPATKPTAVGDEATTRNLGS